MWHGRRAHESNIPRFRERRCRCGSTFDRARRACRISKSWRTARECDASRRGERTAEPRHEGALPARHVRRRQSLHRALHRRGRSRVDRSAFGVAQFRQAARRESHQQGQEDRRAILHQAQRSESRILLTRHRRIRRVQARRGDGAGLRDDQSPRDAGADHVRCDASFRQAR